MNKILKFIYRFKILHILFWIVKGALLYHELERNHPVKDIMNWIDMCNTIFYQIVCVYIIVYALIPRVIKSENYVKFSLSVLGLLLLFSLADITTQTTYVLWLRPERSAHLHSILVGILVNFVELSMISIIFIIIYLVRIYYKRDRQNKQIEHNRLETELNFLKAQMNPHFLFNALNSIYVLMKEDIQLAEQTLLRFSALLRYQLYDCNANETSLENEIEFLKNFISIEKVRTNENLVVNLSVPDRIPHLSIAPFILIPFVENSFKHISHFIDKTNRIDISIFFENKTLKLNVENTFDQNLIENNIGSKGIGLQNVKRRLELLYPGTHLLHITQHDYIYTIKLMLELHGN